MWTVASETQASSTGRVKVVPQKGDEDAIAIREGDRPAVDDEPRRINAHT
jgi:hypothetical protein